MGRGLHKNSCTASTQEEEIRRSRLDEVRDDSRDISRSTRRTGLDVNKSAFVEI